MPAISSSRSKPVWDQFRALLPPHAEDHPLGCHRCRIANRIVLRTCPDPRLQLRRTADRRCRLLGAHAAATADEWIAAGVMDLLAAVIEDTDDRIIGLASEDLAVDGCIMKAPWSGKWADRSFVARGKQGVKRSTVVEGRSIP